MSKAEDYYHYLKGMDKYDTEVVDAVNQGKISHGDANKIAKMQEMMRNERAMREGRKVITSENRADFMAEKLGLKEEPADDMEHFIKHKPTGELLGPYKNRSHAEKNFDILQPKSDYEHVSQKRELAQDRINKKRKG